MFNNLNRSKYIKFQKNNSKNGVTVKKIHDANKKEKDLVKGVHREYQIFLKHINIEENIIQRFSKFNISFDSLTTSKISHLTSELMKNRIQQKEIKQWLESFLISVFTKIEYLKNDKVDITKIFNEIDSETAAYLEKYSLSGKIACKSGCSACCHQPIPTNTLEVENIILNYPELVNSLDVTQLEHQSHINMTNYATDSSYERMTCSFLDKDGSCKIYKDRPSICRSFMVLDNPDSCNIFGESTANPRSFAATESSAYITALDSTHDSFFLPELLYYYRTKKS